MKTNTMINTFFRKSIFCLFILCSATQLQAQYVVTGAWNDGLGQVFFSLEHTQCGGSTNVSCAINTTATPPVGHPYTYNGSQFIPADSQYQPGNGSPVCCATCLYNVNNNGWVSGSCSASVCQYQGIQLSVSPPQSGTWTGTGSFNPMTTSDGTIQFFMNDPSIAGTFQFIADNNGCNAKIDVAFAGSAPLFECEYNINDTGWVAGDCSIELCEGQSLRYSYPGCNANWRIDVNGPNGFSANEIGGCGDLLISNSATSSLNGTYSVRITDMTSACFVDGEFTVNVTGGALTCAANTPTLGWHQLPNCAVTVCQDESLELSVDPDGLASYSWIGPNGFSGSGNANGDILIATNMTSTQAGTYTITATDNSGCTYTEDIIVTVTDLPSLSIGNVACKPGSTTYTIDFTSNGTVTSDVGTIDGNQVIDIPSGTSATITSELNGCTVIEMITMPPTCSGNVYDVSLDKTANPTQAAIGDPVVFTITVINNGDAVTGATVSELLPAGVTYDGSTYTASVGTFDGTTWTIGDMAVGAVETLDFTVTINAEGVHINEASISINETENDVTNNEDDACVSTPVEICDDGSQAVDLMAADGFTSYQWYQDGVAINGATAQMFQATEAGSYNYTVDGGILGDECTNQMCCDVVIIAVPCVVCPPQQCIPITINRVNLN